MGVGVAPPRTNRYDERTMKRSMRVLFSGMVQGVGFRFTSERIARHFAVTGFVRNLPDGKVELAAEGEEAVLQDFLKAVCESAMRPFIRDQQVTWGEAEGRFQAFGIAY